MNLKIQGLLVILGATLVGLAGGVIVERTRDNPSIQARPNGQRVPREGFGRGGQRGPFPRGFDELQLTEAQSNRIDSILERWRPRTEAVMAEFFPRIQALRDSVRTEVDAVLTPEQLERLSEIMPQSRRDGRNPFDRRGGGGRPGRRPPNP